MRHPIINLLTVIGVIVGFAIPVSIVWLTITEAERRDACEHRGGKWVYVVKPMMVPGAVGVMGCKP